MKNYMNPPIPIGFEHVGGEWNKAFIIEDVKQKNQFTWCPINVLVESHKIQLEKTDELLKDMLDKYGGIYISTYPIFQNGSENKKYWTRVTFRRARAEAANICKKFRGSAVRTRLLYEDEYDAIVECLEHLSKQPMITDSDFEVYGLYGMNDLWIWTLTHYSEFSMILKKGNPKNYSEKVYANNEWFESPEVGIRVVLAFF